MSWFRRKRKRDKARRQQIAELYDPYDRRASVDLDNDRVLVDITQVLDNVDETLSRIDLHPATPISIEDDVVSVQEIGAIVQLQMMATIIARTVNSGATIMRASYPEELVQHAIPASYDLRTLTRLQMSDTAHELARTVVNRRLASTDELVASDITAEVTALSEPDQINAFIATFYLVGKKIGHIQDHLGRQ